MQDVQAFLDYLALLPIALAFAMFLFHLWKCWQRCAIPHHIPGAGKMAEPQTGSPAVVEPEQCDQADLETQWTTAAKAMLSTQITVEDSAIADPNRMTAQQPREECKKLNIQWRDVHGTGKHLSKKQMLQRIEEAIA